MIHSVPFYPVGGNPYNNISDDAGKIFVGGIPAEASKENIIEYFSQYGSVSDCIIMVDNHTSRSRGFCFVTFVDQITVNKVLAVPKHVINGKAVDAKKAVPKGPNQSSILKAMGISPNRADRNPESKIFAGGIAQGTTESDLETYFKEFGTVLEVKIPKDQSTQRARGFAFVLFDNPDCVNNATKDRYHRINNKTVEVKNVQIQNKKGYLSPYMLRQRSGYYQSYPEYLSPGMTPHGYYDQPGYEPSPSSTGSAASLESSGYGGLLSHSARGQQGLDNYQYMAPLYHSMADMSISGRYVRPYQIPGGGNHVGGSPYAQTPSALSPSYSEYSSGGGAAGGVGANTGYTNYATRPSGVASFSPVSTPQPGLGNQSFPR